MFSSDDAAYSAFLRVAVLALATRGHTHREGKEVQAKESASLIAYFVVETLSVVQSLPYRGLVYQRWYRTHFG